MGKFLVVADIEDTCSATPRGLQLAAKLGYAVEVVAFAYEPLKRLKLSKDRQAKVRKQLLAEREKSMQARIDKYRDKDQKVTLKVVWRKDIHPWVIQRAASGFNGVIKTGHRSESALYTSTDWHLLRECPAPVFIVAEKKWNRTKSILATVDLGTRNREKKKLNDKVVAQAKLLSAALDAPLNIICAIEVPTLLADMDLVDEGQYVKEQKQAMTPHIKQLAEAHDLPASVFRCKKGPVAKVIGSEAARVRAQLVIMGTVGRRGVKARLIGNTAEAVLRHLRTDILTIKP